jgi:hypothetical protein
MKGSLNSDRLRYCDYCVNAITRLGSVHRQFLVDVAFRQPARVRERLHASVRVCADTANPSRLGAQLAGWAQD